jgi:hypothetical protein
LDDNCGKNNFTDLKDPSDRSVRRIVVSSQVNEFAILGNERDEVLELQLERSTVLRAAIRAVREDRGSRTIGFLEPKPYSSPTPT